MHKSNAVPIIDQKQAIEISQMRRSWWAVYYSY
jgi:hypothetical protein